MPSRNKGFALLIVLWSMVFIGLLTTRIIASGRTSLVLAGNLRAAAQAKAAADGAINEAIYHMLLSGADAWRGDGSVHVTAEGGIPVSVRIDSLAGTINPNIASTALLAGLFQAAGSSPGQAQKLAGAIIAWRSLAQTKDAAAALQKQYRNGGMAFGPPAHDFADVSELQFVMGMNPDLLAAVLPELSLYQTGDPDPAKADAMVRQALKLAGQTGAKSNVYTGAAPVFSIEAVAGWRGGLAVRRRAVVSLPGENGPKPFQILRLTDGY